MVFSSYIFLLCFLPLVIVIYYLLSALSDGIYQRLFLIASSLVFYGYYRIEYLILILASMIANYLIAVQIQNFNNIYIRKVYLTVGILFNVGLIGYFKYYDFFVENINYLSGSSFALRHLLLPLGISFFTFQQLSFLISVYKGEERVEKLKDYCLFVTFFPQLVAGPIVLYGEMIPQFKEENRRLFCAENFSAGLYIFSIGIFKKAVIADTLATFVDNGFSLSSPGLVASWIISLSYTLQIYFDFSGYSDMAVGLGKMFNIDIPFNFCSPYLSTSITEFWRRWHITLGRALSTYIYKPLGGNRKGKVRTCINLLLTFLISGLWHGAAWTFVLWGGLHGLFVVIERIAGDKLKLVPNSIRVAITFLIVDVLWVLFRANGFTQAIKIYRGMIGFNNFEFSQLATIAGSTNINFPAVIDYHYILAIIITLLIVVFKCRNSKYLLKSFDPNRSKLVLTAFFFSIAILCLSRESVFIYFNF